MGRSDTRTLRTSSGRHQGSGWGRRRRLRARSGMGCSECDGQRHRAGPVADRTQGHWHAKDRIVRWRCVVAPLRVDMQDACRIKAPTLPAADDCGRGARRTTVPQESDPSPRTVHRVPIPARCCAPRPGSCRRLFRYHALSCGPFGATSLERRRIGLNESLLLISAMAQPRALRLSIDKVLTNETLALYRHGHGTGGVCRLPCNECAAGRRWLDCARRPECL